MTEPVAKFSLLDLLHKTTMDGNQFKPLNAFVQIHDVEKRSDEVGDDNDLYKADNVEYIDRFSERHGFDAGTDKAIYDRINPDLDEYQKSSRQNALAAMLSLWQNHPTHADLD